MAELLLSHGADAGAVDSAGHDALYYGLRTQDKALWKLLQQALSWRRGGQPVPFCNFKILPNSSEKLLRIPFVPMETIHLTNNWHRGPAFAFLLLLL